MSFIITAFSIFTALVLTSAQAFCNPLPPIKTVTIDNNRAFHVNGKPFFPLMAWLQDAVNFNALKETGMNATAGYRAQSEENNDVIQYLNRAQQAGLYGIMPFDTRLKDHPALLGYIHGDEPDLPVTVSDANIEAAKQLILNPKTPLWKIVDGDHQSWSVLDPLNGASFTIKLKKPITVTSFAVWLTISKGLSVAREIRFQVDKQTILKAHLVAKTGKQLFRLPDAVTFSAVTITVSKLFPGKKVWGSLAEIEAFDSDGNNALLSRPRLTVRKTPAETMRSYNRIQSSDSTRPVFMTLTGYFHPKFYKRRALPAYEYPEYGKATDVLGYDIYPIFGWNKPEWIHLTHEATDMLVKMTDNRPVYVWIETSRGGQHTGPLKRQHKVTPLHIRAEVWMSICRGATAIGYFTHRWKPTYQQFGVPENNRKTLRKINDQITRLTPDILAEPSTHKVKITNQAHVKLDVMAKERNDILSIFSVNYDERLKSADAIIHVQGLKKGTVVSIVDENRIILAKQGYFIDEFAPLAVHIYQITGAFD